MEERFVLSRSQLERVFTEWARAIIDDPDAFDPEPVDPVVSGVAMADYFVEWHTELHSI